MKRLKNRKTAILITVVAAILATLFGVHRSLDRLARDIETMFYTGVYSDGYRHPSIDSQLKKEAEAALGIVTIAKNYDELAESAEDLRLGRLALLAAESIEDKALASLRMGFEFDYLHYAYLDVEMPEHDRAALEDYISTFFGASEVIWRERTAYNDAVTKFLDGEAYSGLAAVIKPLAFVESPQLFINYQS